MTSNAVATPHHLSAEAGRLVLAAGGNAVDAAIAVVAAQGVVAPETCGLGGDLFALISRPGWETPRVLNSSGRAGSNADGADLRSAGEAGIPLDHPLVVTIPGCVDGLVTLADELGSRPLGDVLEPAIQLARAGFAASNEQADAFSRQADVYRDNPAVASFYPGGQPVSVGDMVIRPELADTLARLAETGDRDQFYLGMPGEDIVAAVGGLITMDDLGRSQAEWVTPLGIEALGLTGWTTPPNTQGYLGPATLAVFEMLDPPDDPEHPMWWHLLIEAYRCLAWERDDLVADPGHLSVPAEILADRSRLERLAGTITGEAGVWPSRLGGTSSTAYMCVVDGDGLAVSIIQSNFHGTGSPFGAARSGFLLHNRGAGFTLTEGHPNQVGPGRRPLHTLSPTLWTDGDRPVWVIGTRGGDIQPQLVAQMAARVIGARVDPGRAQAMPRWAMADFGPATTSSVAFEPGVPRGVLDDLRSRGHMVSELTSLQGGWGPVSVIGIDGDSRVAAADPRVDTTAALVF